jgi:hypothetical protein
MFTVLLRKPKPTMTRYDKNTRLEAVIRADQKQWLRSQATGMRSISDILRDIIDKAIANEKAHG